MRHQFKLASAALAAGLLFAGSQAMADTETGTLAVTATVNGACSIGDGALAFGSFNSINVDTDGTKGSTSNIDANDTIDVVCTNGTSGIVTFSNGSNVDLAVRRLSDGAGTPSYLNYRLYSDAYTTEIPADAGATDAYTVVGDGTDKTITVYGRIASSDITNQPDGNYTDSVSMTITYTP